MTALIACQFRSTKRGTVQRDRRERLSGKRLALGGLRAHRMRTCYGAALIPRKVGVNSIPGCYAFSAIAIDVHRFDSEILWRWFPYGTTLNEAQRAGTHVMTGDTSIFKVSGTEIELERAFIAEFRGPGLRWTACAAGAGSLLFGVFLLIGVTLESHTQLGIAIRAALCAFLALVACLLWWRLPIVERNYVAIAALASTVALGGTVLLLVLQDGKPHLSAIQAAPAIIFGLSLHYAFLRLPLAVSAAIGWVMTLAAILFVPSSVGGGEFVRNVVYLAFANLFGMVLSRLVESRERELFVQRKRAELAQSAAEEANQQKTRLIAAVSHDLRQPMTAALSYIDVVKFRLRVNDFEGAGTSLERAHGAVSMLGATLDHLLTAARYDSGTEAMNISLVELTPVLRGAYDTLIADAERRGVTLRVRLPRVRAVLETDARSLSRVLCNLLANAIKFTDARSGRSGKVLIAARLRKGICLIEVIDTGIGIEPSLAKEIWKPFVQLNNIERDRERGLGLGLFLVRKIVEQLPGHSISMSSRIGHGSRFTLTVPASALDCSGTAAIPAVAVDGCREMLELQGAYVFLLEDDRDTRDAVAAMLEAWGVQVTSGATLTDLLSQHADSDRLVDALICDYRLAGGTNGVDAIATLRDRLGYAPHAVLVTGEPDIAPIRARAGPETTVLHKPFPPDSLAKPLLRAVRAARLLEEG